jgi:hypothetical protein
MRHEVASISGLGECSVERRRSISVEAQEILDEGELQGQPSCGVLTLLARHANIELSQLTSYGGTGPNVCHTPFGQKILVAERTGVVNFCDPEAV